MNKHCILYLCQDICEETIYRYNKLVNEKPNNYDIYWVIDEDKYDSNVTYKEDLNFLPIIDNEDKKEKYTKLCYAWENSNDMENSGKHYNCILNYIEAYNKIPSYDYYWCIEFDVYMHNFADLFNYYDNLEYDNVSSHLMNKVPNCYNNNPMKLKLFNINNIYNADKCPAQFSGFYSISRLSNRLLKLCLDYYQGGNFGFFESTITMITIYNNLSITALNNNFISVTPENKSYQFQVDVSSNSWSYHVIKKYRDYFLSFNKIIHPIKLSISIKELKAR